MKKVKKVKRIVVGLLVFVTLSLLGGVFAGCYADAADNSQFYGVYVKNVVSYPGVRIYQDGQKILEIIDHWEYGSTYQYTGFLFKGEKYSSYVFSDLVRKVGKVGDDTPKSGETRVSMYPSELLSRYGGDYSIVTHRMKNGEKYKEPVVEYSGGKPSEELGEYSLCQYTCKMQEYHPNAISYDYRIYRAIDINTTSKIKMSTQGGKLNSYGKGYNIETGYKIAKLPTASYTKAGYDIEFLGWYTKPEGGTQIKENDIIKSDEGVYAHWKITPLKYDITVVDVCKTGDKEIKLGEFKTKAPYETTLTIENMGASKENDAYYKGYHLSSLSNCKVEMSGSTLYRYFDRNEYKISFDSNGSTHGEMDNVLYEYNIDERLPKNIFQRRHNVLLSGLGEDGTETTTITVAKEFLGWASEKDGLIEFSDEGNIKKFVASFKDVVLYAVWDNEKKYIDYIPTKAGYEFMGWSLSPNGVKGEKSFNITEDTTLYAVWKGEEARYCIEYYKENNAGDYDYVTSVDKIAFSGKEVSADLWEDMYDGYKADLEKSTVKGIVTSDGGLTLKVYLRKTQKTMKFDYSKADNANDYTVKPVDMKIGDTIVLPEIPLVKRGYKFMGWSLEESSHSADYKPGEKVPAFATDKTMYAYFEPIVYEVSFDKNGSDITGTIGEIRMRYDQQAEAPLGSYCKKGYRFVSWNTKADGSGRNFKAGDKLKNLTEHDGDKLVLYAQWQTASIPIRYDKNFVGGMTSVVNGTVENTEYCFDADSYASTQSYVAMGYTMIGWNTKADGSGTYINLGDKINGIFQNETEGVLYAVWKADGDVAFQVNLIDCTSGNSVKVLTLHGKAGQKVSEVIKMVYAERLEMVEMKHFYEGYEVANLAVLEDTINGDASTLVTVLVKKTDYSVQIVVDGDAVEIEKTSENSDEIKLPENLTNGTSVARYTDDKGNIYYPGDKIIIKEDTVLQPEKLIIMETGESKDKLTTDFVVYNKDYILPEVTKDGHSFLGWYSENGEYIGAAGEVIPKVTDNKKIVAKWSEPLEYNITFDYRNKDIVILENMVKKYTYGTETVLPVKSQMLIPEGVEFLGWHIVGTPEGVFADKIDKTISGDICLEAVYKEDDAVKNESEGQNDSQNTEKEGKEGSQNTESEGQDSSQITEKEEKKGTTVFWVGNRKYKITGNHVKKKTVTLIKVKKVGKKLSIPKYVTYKGVKYTVTKIGKKAASGLKTVEHITIPDTVTSIGESAFSNAKKLKKVIIGKNVATIKKNAFNNCRKLTKIYITGKKIKTVQNTAFGKNKKCKIITAKSVKEKYKTLIARSKSKGRVCS